MPHEVRRHTVYGKLLALAFVLIVLPACHTTDGLRRRPMFAEPYTAARPVYPPRNTLHLSSYAGYQYPPVVPGYRPTAYGSPSGGHRLFPWRRAH